VDVSDEEILMAMTTLARYSGVFGEPAGVTGFAGLQKMVREGLVKKDESVALIVSGNGLKDVKSAMKAVQKPEKVKPNLEALIKYVNINGGKNNV
jgi:threonine synthase